MFVLKICINTILWSLLGLFILNHLWQTKFIMYAIGGNLFMVKRLALGHKNINIGKSKFIPFQNLVNTANWPIFLYYNLMNTLRIDGAFCTVAPL